ncbi:MAG: transcription-repair coupling factor [Acidobacteria bacterium CG_4_9_14_3_um_filter_49_7]|nr:MAG: transcription-repair coupling factor [Acidobacteria bacterium CG_4_9_14_3_um_filter_49_7]
MNLKRIVFSIFSGKFNLNEKALPPLPGSLLTLFLAFLQEKTGKPILLVTADENSVYTIKQDLPQVNILPETAVMPSTFLSPHLKVKQQYFNALKPLASPSGVAITVAHPTALMQRFPDSETILSLFLSIEAEEEVSVMELAGRLTRLGYESTDVVRTREEFSRRGNIIDVFPINLDTPVRIETEFDIVSSIRGFDPITQRSMTEVDKVEIFPVRLFPDTPENREELAVLFSKEFSNPDLAMSLEEKLNLIQNGEIEGFDHYFHLLWPKNSMEALFKEHFIVVLDPAGVHDVTDAFLKKAENDYEQAAPQGYIGLNPGSHFLSGKELFDFFDSHDNAIVAGISAPGPFRPLSIGGRTAAVTETIVGTLEKMPVILGVRSPGEAERIENFLFENSIAYSRKPVDRKAVLLEETFYRSGFEIVDQLSFLTTADLFPGRRSEGQRPVHTPFFSDFSDIKPGDYVVHLDYGIARYQGLKIMSVDEASEECLELVFQGKSRVMLPVSRLHLLQKYQGSGGTVQLSSLRSTSWQKVKKRIQKEVSQHAEELLKLYAKRKLAKGIAFPADSIWQREFEEIFPYDETEDQIQAIEEIKKDMEAAAPMDRLLCGDVGFGKTEVAMRAVFKAVDNGRQVMVLAPTTVLAFQHYQTFQERFRRFPMEIRMLSRFVSPVDQRKTLGDVACGDVDIIIGTHRLLSKDVIVPKLGLLIVDEEQKFGVLHKERMKMLKQNIEVLSLSATPIPRTLNMSVMGLKDISIIESPPRDRLAINTYHIVFDPLTISEAIQFEMKRGGQIYFVNNHVQTIETLAQTVRKLAPPETRIAVAHGQLPEAELEAVMLRFFRHEIDILVSTAIIENGMDVSVANTMFINEAHTFGLSQLYQLRGRIGRSDKPSYAYLITPGKQKLAEVARKRLQALEEFSHLGAGFRIAMLDLELRGAGDILGARQSGHINSVGFEMYLKMLENAVKKLKSLNEEVEEETVLEIGQWGRIPSDYIESSSVRLSFYRRMNMATSTATLKQTVDEMVDRFGTLPPSVLALTSGQRVRLIARKLGILAISFKGNICTVTPGEKHLLDVEKLLHILPKTPGVTLDSSGFFQIERSANEEIEMFISRIGELLVTFS